ncbi:hypothetical protein [Streptomyces clavuligerus]|uniref:hypothetical protein n=1 Tax=Streptomyces clavuligerus TaxID=1901 RepID=UPI001E5A9810|nr:hypothetical protein [Streptomyces clavuligerus]
MTAAVPMGDGLLDGGLVGVLPGHVADRLAAASGTGGLRQVSAASRKERSRNAWFRGELRDEKVFVKLYAVAARGAAERLVARAVPPEVTTRLLGGGRAAGLGEYAVFRWQPLTRLPVGLPESAVAAGRLLALAGRHRAVADAVPDAVLAAAASSGIPALTALAVRAGAVGGRPGGLPEPPVRMLRWLERGADVRDSPPSVDTLL